MSAIKDPNQKLGLGRYFKNKKEIIPTQIGDKLVSNVACVAEEFWMETFQTAMSAANKTPQSAICSINFFESSFNFPFIKAKGNKIATAIAIR